MRKIELLCPASSLEVLKIAVIYGADAVYIGGEAFGLRAKAKNFSMEEMAEGVAFAHAHGVRVYVTANILAHNYDLDGVREYFTELHNMKPDRPDALIIADPAVFMIAKEVCPEIERHVSTQANNTNYGTYQFWWNLGASRVVTARELSLKEIKEIRGHIDDRMEIETFVHGAMCISYSGRCLLSNYMAGRDANRGQCAQPCRWKYYLVEENRPGQYMPIGENEEGSYILNANDLCTAPFLDLICKAGVDSLKIEGRAKTFYYVASVTAAYRKALDQYLANPASDTFDLPDSVLDELNRTSHRHYSPGFYFGKEKALQTPSHTYVRDWDFIGTVDSWEDGVAHCTQRSKFCLGDSLEILQPDGSVVPVTPEWIKNAEGEAVDATPHPMMQYTIPCATPLMPYSLLRMQKRQ